MSSPGQGNQTLKHLLTKGKVSQGSSLSSLTLVFYGLELGEK